MTEALNNFNSLKADKKFLPRVIVGHQEKEEKPAVGFLDNLKLQGKIVMADLVNLAQKTFDEIRTKAWPSRSVEVNPDKKKFTALALLGGSEPYFQFEPIDVKFEADPDGQWVEFSDSEEKKNLIDTIWQKMLEFFTESNKHGETEMTPEQIQKMIDDAIAKDRVSQAAKFDQELEEKYQAKFKEQFGKDPKTFLDDIEKDKIAKFNERKKLTLETLKSKYNLSPKLVDGYFAAMVDAVSGVEMDTIKFADGQQGDVFQLLDKFGEALAKADEDNTLFVDLGEYARFSGDEGNPNLMKGSGRYIDASEEDLKQLDVEIRKFAEATKVSYNEAAEKVMAAKR
jgi:hypothetical protein